PHVDGDVDLRPRRRAQLRAADRRRDARAGERRPAGDRGVPRGAGMSTLLQVEAITGGYGPVRVLDDVAFTVEDGEVVVILGANGAGKTTTLRALSGMLSGARGRVVFEGEPLLGRKPEAVARRGVAHV